jgi:hypothetical protein
LWDVDQNWSFTQSSTLQSTNIARENVWKCLRGKSTNSMSISIFSMAMLAYQIVNTQTCWQLVSWLHFFSALKGSKAVQLTMAQWDAEAVEDQKKKLMR